MRIIIYIFLLFTFPVLSYATEPDSLFESANAFYSEGEYELAAETYKEILSLGYTSPEVLFNLGNSYFRSNQLGKARLYYEKALLLTPGDKAVQANLAYVESFLTDRYEEVPVFFARRWIINLRKSLAPNTWAVLAISTFLVSFLLLSFYLFAKRMVIKKAAFYPGIVLVIVSTGCLFFSLAASKYLHDSGEAILTVPSAIVKSSPRESGKDLFIIHEGAKVWLENKTGDWQEIRISDGRIGWLPNDFIETI